MWKILLAFIAFAALALFILKKGGADIDMGGEKHGADAVHAPAAAPEAASAAAPAASK
jgi:hypothetical protein